MNFNTLKIESVCTNPMSMVLTFPVELLHLYLKDAKTTIKEGISGRAIFQELTSKHVLLQYNHYVLTQSEMFTFKDSTPRFLLKISLKNLFEFRVKDEIRLAIPEHHYNIVYLPYINTNLTLQPNQTYSSLNFLYAFPYLNQLVNDYPALAAVMQDSPDEMTTMFPTARVVKPEMMLLVERILKAGTGGRLNAASLDNKGKELLLFILDETLQPAEKQLRPDEAKKIVEIKELLCENLHENYTLPQLCRKKGFSIRKLQYGFQKLFGTTIKNFVVQARIERAKELLKNREKSIEEIAHEIGYTTRINFTRIFHEKVGESPSNYRKMQG